MGKKSQETLLYKPKTALGKQLSEIRARIIASGELLLDWEDIDVDVWNLC